MRTRIKIVALLHRTSCSTAAGKLASGWNCWEAIGLPTTLLASVCCEGSGAWAGCRGFAAAAPEAGARRLISDAVEGQLQRTEERYAALSAELSGQEAADYEATRLTSIQRELGELQPVVEALQCLTDIKAGLAEADAVLAEAASDEELRSIALLEQQQLLDQLPAAEEAVVGHLLPRDAADMRNVVLEIRAGAGGDEAALFAADLMRMYELFCANQGWKFEVLQLSEASVKGTAFKQASATVAGDGVYGLLKWESGVHRVQRVPTTETAGRVHTSTASVAVLPQADAVEVGLREQDLRVDTFRSGGAGGQHVNTTDSAVRITHMPSGLVVVIQDERSQHKNRAKAMKVLQARLYEQARAASAREQASQRKSLIGTADRSERIRTYNFPQGRVTDHRVGLTEHGMEAVLSGERLLPFIEALQQQHKAELIQALGQ